MARQFVRSGHGKLVLYKEFAPGTQGDLDSTGDARGNLQDGAKPRIYPGTPAAGSVANNIRGSAG